MTPSRRSYGLSGRILKAASSPTATTDYRQIQATTPALQHCVDVRPNRDGALYGHEITSAAEDDILVMVTHDGTAREVSPLRADIQ